MGRPDIRFLPVTYSNAIEDDPIISRDMIVFSKIKAKDSRMRLKKKIFFTAWLTTNIPSGLISDGPDQSSHE